MISYNGKCVYEGIAIGAVRLIETKKKIISGQKVEDVQRQTEIFNNARAEAKAQLEKLYESTVEKVGPAQAEIFSIHMLMVDDLDFEDLVTAKISEGYNAEYSVSEAAKELAEMFSSMDDEYMQGRAADVLDVAERLTDVICGVNLSIGLEEKAILIAEDISPSEIVSFRRENILGIVTAKGSASSHMAIIARSMSIPSVVGTDVIMDKDYEGKTAIIDGFKGVVIIDPTEAQLEEYSKKAEELEREELFRKSLIGKANVTKDGKTLEIYCNIGKSKDVSLALASDAYGIGLMRSEFLYLESNDYPDEEYQFREYKQVLESMNPMPVIIRTMDIGADKKVDYFNLPEEENPAMGLRSVRICFERPEIMRTQLRALYRASIFGNLKIMIPMITSAEEVKWVKKMAFDVRNELKAEGIAFNESVEIGIMIETPAAAIISDELAEIADFFSIGSNDLSQYTLAIDRQNSRLDHLFNPMHKAILRLIKIAADNAHAKGKWVGICGELARNTELTEFFVAIGLDELSVSAPYVLKVREKLLSIDSSKIDIDKFIK